MKNYYLHILPGSVLPRTQHCPILFQNIPGPAWLGIFALSQHFLHKSDGISNCVFWAHLQSARAAAKQLQTSQIDCEVCSGFVLFWNIENRDGIIGTLRNTGIKSALSGGGKVELVDSMIVRAAGVSCLTYLWFQRTDLDSPKRSLVMRLIRREHSQSQHTLTTRLSRGREERERGRVRVRCCKFTISWCLH